MYVDLNGTKLQDSRIYKKYTHWFNVISLFFLLCVVISFFDPRGQRFHLALSWYVGILCFNVIVINAIAIYYKRFLSLLISLVELFLTAAFYFILKQFTESDSVVLFATVVFFFCMDYVANRLQAKYSSKLQNNLKFGNQ